MLALSAVLALAMAGERSGPARSSELARAVTLTAGQWPELAWELARETGLTVGQRPVLLTLTPALASLPRLAAAVWPRPAAVAPVQAAPWRTLPGPRQVQD